MEGGTAWLEHADCHGQGTAAFWPDPAAYTAAVRQLHAAGVRTATHAIGDAAVRHVLDTVEGLGAGGRFAHRIEHVETAPDGTLSRFAHLGVIASMQPPHTAYTRDDHGDEWSRRLGPERGGRAWRTRDLRDAGAVVALGSDWHDACGRRRRRGSSGGAYPPGCRADLTAFGCAGPGTSHRDRWIRRPSRGLSPLDTPGQHGRPDSSGIRGFVRSYGCSSGVGGAPAGAGNAGPGVQ
ncbi:hypothetical protein GCM10011579_074820 [Streptomyces albiflavescens]|uniref:Amidohydrolase 3 domain-containing protein n=1 Tax=Streptomyces albiflavescens TaxID=1623582 RepID=A0A918D879_9ACTN|nr:hypothetical protein GCM10011579_074820 [Streptomyces albiflavescens]